MDTATNGAVSIDLFVSDGSTERTPIFCQDWYFGGV